MTIKKQVLYLLILFSLFGACISSLQSQTVLAQNAPPVTLLTAKDGIPYFSDAQYTPGKLAELISNLWWLTLGLVFSGGAVMLGINAATGSAKAAMGEIPSTSFWTKNGDIIWALLLISGYYAFVATIDTELTQLRFVDTLQETVRYAEEIMKANVPPPEPDPDPDQDDDSDDDDSDMPPDNKLEYQPGIKSQLPHASPKLNTLLGCMANKMPGNIGEVSSISDSRIVSGKATFEYCAGTGACAHERHSAHYGGTKCIGKSYAVDFGDEKNFAEIRDAAYACNPIANVVHEGDHVHISVIKNTGCN